MKDERGRMTRFSQMKKKPAQRSKRTGFWVILGLRPRPNALHRIGRSPARMCAGTFIEFLARPSAFILCCVIGLSVSAQSYPTRPVRMIIPSGAGGITDILGRVLAQRLSETFGQQVVIDNRPGASGVVGSAIVAKETAEGGAVPAPWA